MKHEQQKHGIMRRGAVGLAKAWSYSLGITSTGRELHRLGGNLGALARNAAGKLRSSPADFRHETFEEAVERLGLDEAHLIRQAKAFNKRSLAWYGSMVLSTAWLAGISYSDSPWSHALICGGLIGMSFAKAITWRFRFCQVRDQELYGFLPWFFSPGRW